MGGFTSQPEFNLVVGDDSGVDHTENSVLPGNPVLHRRHSKPIFLGPKYWANIKMLLSDQI